MDERCWALYWRAVEEEEADRGRGRGRGGAKAKAKAKGRTDIPRLVARIAGGGQVTKGSLRSLRRHLQGVEHWSLRTDKSRKIVEKVIEGRLEKLGGGGGGEGEGEVNSSMYGSVNEVNSDSDSITSSNTNTWPQHQNMPAGVAVFRSGGGGHPSPSGREYKAGGIGKISMQITKKIKNSKIQYTKARLYKLLWAHNCNTRKVGSIN